MNKTLKTAFFQADLSWQNPLENRLYFEKKFAEKLQQHELVVLPEMFTTGFSMQNEHLAEEYEGETLRWMSEQSQKFETLLTGSIIFKENQGFFNRLFAVFPDGKILHYDKKHLFRPANEHLHYSEGNEKLILEWKGFRIMPLICYDLRFPVYSRNIWHEERQQADYDILIYVANFPALRSLAWKTLLRARAIENWAFVLGVNRRGTDGNGIFYSGDSAAVNFLGEAMCELSQDEDFGEVIFEKNLLDDFRKRFPAYMDADKFSISRL